MDFCCPEDDQGQLYNLSSTLQSLKGLEECEPLEDRSLLYQQHFFDKTLSLKDQNFPPLNPSQTG
jgi:hypothetical protein